MTDAGEPELRSTPLAELHAELGGRMVDFAGWSLPIHYAGTIAETLQVRARAGLFDVSHMGVLDVRGPNVAAALETLTPAGLQTLAPGRMRYALLTNDEGGIIDDMMVTRPPGDDAEAPAEHLVLVVNGARRQVDLAHLRAGLDGTASEVTERAPYALLALQGPAAMSAMIATMNETALNETALNETAMAEQAQALEGLRFMETTTVEAWGTRIEVSRSGYTGEDGLEIIVAADAAEALARRLLAQPSVAPAGLGARDALRLEAGLCLYGSDLDETTSPVEAALVWSIPRHRRDAGGFPGSARIRAELRGDGPRRLRVGLIPQGKRPVRTGATLADAGGNPIGVVTSGGYGPTVEHPVAMGYVPPPMATPGTTLVADVRGHAVTCTVTELPFTPHRYVRGNRP